MFDQLNLDQIGRRLRQVDQELVALMGQRMRLSLQVEEYKRTRNEAIFRPDVEKRRLDEVCELARHHGMNPEFARSVFYAIIGESCKMQMIQLQKNAYLPDEDIDEEQWNARLKENLLNLTARCAPIYDKEYDAGFYATRLHADFEQSMILGACQHYRGTGLAIDLGCGTGRVALTLADSFTQIVGYDISPDMIEVARRKYQDAHARKCSFEVVDLEAGIPHPDSAVSFVVMGMGFASDIRLLPKVLREVHRVLIPGGTAFMSFYNAEALIYHWEFIPWPVGLAAEINPRKHCLNVQIDDKVYEIYARPYTTDEVHDLMPRGLPIIKLATHPTVCSIMPDVLFDDKRVQDSIATIDEKLADENMGAYITVLARKS